MRGENAIVVENITKSFKVYLDKGKTLKDRLVTAGRDNYQKREVLKGISFTVKKGEAVGLIGKNGCGKSTTLKMLTKIIYPDSGNIEIKGKISSLLELGAGFHPDMSGRENIYLNASIFGLTKKEIDRKIDGIIEFSELEEFIENPVRTYSSGMYMRLAFSVAINVDAEVLLIDEILGVGDVSFQKKCFERLQEIKATGTTIVIVSHSLEQIERICDRCIWIYDGLIREEGMPADVNFHYYKEMETQRLLRCKEENDNYVEQAKKAQEDVETVPNEQENSQDEEEKEVEQKTGQEEPQSQEESQTKEEHANAEKNPEECIPEKKQVKQKLPHFLDRMACRVGNRDGEFVDVSLKNPRDGDNMIFYVGDSMEVLTKIKGNKKLPNMNVSVSITREDGVYCYGTNTKYDKYKTINLDEKSREIAFYFDNMQLLPGKYYVNLGLYDDKYNEYDVIWNAKKIYVKDEDPSGEIGVFRMEHHWSY